MASQRFIVLINNIIVRDLANNPIFEVHEGQDTFYSNAKGDNDLSERVEEVIAQTLAEESENPLNELVQETRTLTRHNQEFRLKMFITPLYELQMQLANNPNATRIAGSNVNIQELWEEQAYTFYTVEFLKYTQIIDYLESAVKIRRPQNSPFTIKHKDHRVMNILYLQVNGLFNPLDTVSFLKKTKLFNKVYGRNEEHNISIAEPTVFQVEIMRGAVTCFFATSSDILKLCNIRHKEAISTRDAYRLIAGMCLKIMFAGKQNTMHQGILSFPVSKTLYQMVDPTDGSVARYFENAFSANEYAEEEGYNINTLDTDAMFIASAFPSFKNKNITQETVLLREIRGAEFVQ